MFGGQKGDRGREGRMERGKRKEQERGKGASPGVSCTPAVTGAHCWVFTKVPKCWGQVFCWQPSNDVTESRDVSWLTGKWDTASVTKRWQDNGTNDRSTISLNWVVIPVPVVDECHWMMAQVITLCLKKGTPTLSTVALERINGF